MFKVSDIITTPPTECSSELQRKVYETFASLDIPFERVDTDPGLTMEDCQHIDEKIGVRIVKTVFLCNRQQIPRVSFAPADKLMELTGVLVGATTILSAILPSCEKVHLVMDRSVAESEMFACTDGTATCFVKIKTEDLLGRYIPASGNTITLI